MVVGPNVISCELITGSGEGEGDKTRWFLVGFYSPPSDKDGTTRRLVETALETRPEGTRPLTIGDWNANLDFPRDRQEEILSAGMRKHGLSCATRYFVTRRKRHVRGRWTWRQQRDNGRGDKQWIHSKPDYFLTRAEDRKKLRRCRWITPPKSNSDHRALVVKLALERGGGAAHVKRRKRFPLQLPQTGPATEGEKIFEVPKTKIEKPARREREENAWIRPVTWALIDEWSKLRSLGRLTQA